MEFSNDSLSKTFRYNLNSLIFTIIILYFIKQQVQLIHNELTLDTKPSPNIDHNKLGPDTKSFHNTDPPASFKTIHQKNKFKPRRRNIRVKSQQSNYTDNDSLSMKNNNGRTITAIPLLDYNNTSLFDLLQEPFIIGY